jgi:hypothetical protein
VGVSGVPEALDMEMAALGVAVIIRDYQLPCSES